MLDHLGSVDRLICGGDDDNWMLFELDNLTILRVVHLAIAHAHIICEQGVTSENGETVCKRFVYNHVVESSATFCSKE